MAENKDHFYAYAAGLIDGEGSIGFYWRNSNRGKKFYLMLRINLTDRVPLDRLVTIFGVGSVKGPYKHSTKDGFHRRETWTFNCVNECDIHLILSAIKPFTIIKRTQIDIALNYLNSPPWKRRTTATYHEMRQLKKATKIDLSRIEKRLPLFENIKK